MATKKNLTPAEIKAAKKDLAAALKLNQETMKPYTAAVKDVEKALAVAKKEADKAVVAATKALDAAAAKAGKAAIAAAKGEEKIKAKLAELEPEEEAS